MRKTIIRIVLITCFLFIMFTILSRFSGTSFINRSNFKSDILTEKEREWLQKHGKIIYSADRNAPPLRFVDKSDEQYKGVVVDYINSISLEMGFELQLYPQLWESALNSLSKGETDVCDMFMSEERSKYYLFSKPIYNLGAVLAVGREDYQNNIATINSMTIATQKGDYTNEFLMKNYPGAKLTNVSDINEALKLLVDGKVDGVVGDEPVVLYQLGQNNLSNKVKITGEPLYKNEVVFAVPKSEPELVSILDKGIDLINSKGQLEKIQQKWFGISTPLMESPDIDKLKNYIIISVLIASIISFMLLFWNQSLKEQVDLRTKELKDSRNDLQIVFDGITEYMIVVDRNKNIINVNKSFLEYAGGLQGEVLNKPCKDYLTCFCTDCRDCIISKTLETAVSCKAEVLNKSEVYEINTYPIMNSYGIIKNILLVINNVTSEKISKNQILQANKMIAIGQLAAGIAHEIRNPLGIVRNHSFILRSNYNNDNIISRSLDYIDSSIIRASNIIDNLLNFSRISGNILEWTHIKYFISSIAELQHKYMQKSNIEFEIDCDENLRCIINQESLKHILINLIDNAADAIGENGKLTLKAYEKTNGIAIECIDTGCGIPKDNLEKIFNPFFTTKEPGKGTGLGLYIVYSEIKKLNGEISVTSELGKGTAFKIFLPVEMEANVS